MEGAFALVAVAFAVAVGDDCACVVDVPAKVVGCWWSPTCSCVRLLVFSLLPFPCDCDCDFASVAVAVGAVDDDGGAIGGGAIGGGVSASVVGCGEALCVVVERDEDDR